MIRTILLTSVLILCTSCSFFEEDEAKNTPPTATISQSGHLVLPDIIDPDGDTLTYTWHLNTNNALLSTNKNLDITPFLNIYSGYHLVKLTISDGKDSTEYDTNVLFTGANNSPTANPTQTNNLVLSQAMDIESDAITYKWMLTSNSEVLGQTSTLDITSLLSTYNGIHSVTLTVSDASGSNSYPISVDFGAAPNDTTPNAVIQPSLSTATVVNGQPVTITFDARTSNDDKGITHYQWNINGQSSTGETANYDFTKAGTYSVQLTVTDTANQVNTASLSYVVDEQTSQTDVVKASANKTIGAAPETITFNSSNSILLGQNYTYSWHINGQTLPGQSVQHTFNTAGIYTATLTISNNNGIVGTDSVDVQIAKQLASDITSSPAAINNIELGSAITLSATFPNDSITKYEWSIENQNKTGESISHTFSQIGTYDITLKMTNNLGMSDSSTVTAIVKAVQPQPRISVVSNTMLTIKLDVNFDSSPSAYQWVIDGQMIAGKAIEHTFSNAGTYNIALNADYGNGFINQDSIMVTVTDSTNLANCDRTTANDPYCGAHFSVDIDKDGWGMENNVNCVYINGPADPNPGSCKDPNFGDDYQGKGAGLSALAPFPVGLAIPDGTGTSGVNILTDSTRQNILTRDFSQITVENKMKMSYIEYNFNQADAIVNWAEQNNLGVHGHALVWHHESQLPSWAVNPKASFKEDFVASITRTATHFAGKVYSWDVVNEALYDQHDGTGHTNNNGLRNSVYFNQYNGSQYIHEAFKAARAADPHAVLYYNDFSTENNQDKTDALVDLIQELLDNDVPIDGVGFQMHVVNSWPNVSDIRASMKKIVDLDPDLMVKITELDVRINNVYDNDDNNDFVNRNDCLGANSCAGLAAQKARYKEIIEAYLDVVPVHRRGGISVWGVADLDSWLYENNGPQKRPDWPLLFDDNFDKKPAFFGVEETLQNLANFN